MSAAALAQIMDMKVRHPNGIQRCNDGTAQAAVRDGLALVLVSAALSHIGPNARYVGAFGHFAADHLTLFG